MYKLVLKIDKRRTNSLLLKYIITIFKAQISNKMRCLDKPNTFRVTVKFSDPRILPEIVKRMLIIIKGFCIKYGIGKIKSEISCEIEFGNKILDFKCFLRSNIFKEVEQVFGYNVVILVKKGDSLVATSVGSGTEKIHAEEGISYDVINDLKKAVELLLSTRSINS